MRTSDLWSHKHYIEILRISQLLSSMEEARDLLFKKGQLTDEEKLSQELIKKAFRSNPVFAFYE